MNRSRIFFAALTSFGLAACGGSDHGGGDGAPAAPTGLTAESSAGGAHLTWTDNSDNETEFMVMRLEDGVDTDYEVVATVEFNTAQYHDAPLTSGATYMYQIMAMNDDGESLSNEVTFSAP